MDHVKAQQIISDALDKLSVDREELTIAKEHCRECPECAAFVRAMLAVQRSPLPEPPADAAERVMATVRAEAQRTALSKARAIATPVDPLAVESTQPETPPARTFGDLWQRAREPRNRRRVLAWAGAAAMLFVLAGWGALAGIRTILIPPKTMEVTVLGTDTTAESGAGGTADQSRSADRQSAALSAPESDAAARFVVVRGTVYRFVAPALGVAEAELDKIDRIRTSLDTGRIPTSHDVFLGSASDRIYVESSDGLLEFRMVARSYDGREYALQSSDINAFGEWPSLPAGVPAPESESGAPVFEGDGTTDSGSTVYVLSGRTAEEGIALPPNPAAPDPVQGCPVWTWWAPLE